MRQQQLLTKKDFLFVATGLLLGAASIIEGLKCHNSVQLGVFFIYRTTTFGFIHLIFLAAASCCNTANLEHAHFYWHEQV